MARGVRMHGWSRHPHQRRCNGPFYSTCRAWVEISLSVDCPPCGGKVLRKEVIQPQIPLRLPCYDLALLTRFTLGRVLLAVGQRTLGTPCLGGLTGGVYKAREHIHRGVADPRLLAIPASRRRIAASDPN